MNAVVHDDSELVLAAEECAPEQFDQRHRFSRSDEQVIRKLIAHGPVLLRGGRGSGKSALMIAAERRMYPHNPSGEAIGVYVSLRYLPLLRSTGAEYERYFLELLIRRVASVLEGADVDVPSEPALGEVKGYLGELAAAYGRRIVLLFDDAAHIGREASLAEFFDIFRTISSSAVSCKASIYPGVTRFGTRFDIYNDATTIDVARDEDVPEYNEIFGDIFSLRVASPRDWSYSATLDQARTAGFLGRAVLGNMRAYVFALAELQEAAPDRKVTLPVLTRVLVNLSQNYYWPLLDELQPKLGGYEPMLDPARQVADIVYRRLGEKERASVVVVREHLARLAKPFELLEYVGFIGRREVSRAMKSGGRGSRYRACLCNVLEFVNQAQVTERLFDEWMKETTEAVEFNRSSELSAVVTPLFREGAEMGILTMGVEKLRKSPAYPYGLSDQKIEVLSQAGFNTIGALAAADPDELQRVNSVGPAMCQRIQNVVAQAIWM